MKAIRLKFKKKTIWLFLGLNWLTVMLVLFFTLKGGEHSNVIFLTLLIGFMLQSFFLSDQLKENDETNK